jgi:hypothetical protein
MAVPRARVTARLTAFLAFAVACGGDRHRLDAPSGDTGAAGVGVAGVDDSLPPAARAFRDEVDFYLHLRGVRRPTMPRPARDNMDSLTAAGGLAHRAYLATLYSGFVHELEGRLDSAEQSYRRTLTMDVQGEAVYYAHRDLGRLAMKRGDRSDAISHLTEYERLLDLEIRAAGGDLPAGDSLAVEYLPSEAALGSMRADRDRVRRVLDELSGRLPFPEDSVWCPADSSLFSDVVGDPETGDSSGLEFRLIRSSAGWMGWYREAAGEYGPAAPLTSLAVDVGTGRVSFAMPAGNDTSVFEGQLECDRMVGRLRAFRDTPFESATFRRLR